MVKCFAEVHGPEESCHRVAPFCRSLCCDLFRCFSVCDQVSHSNCFSPVPEFDWLSADSDNRHQSPPCTPFLFSSWLYDMTDGGLPVSSQHSATLASSLMTPLGGALSAPPDSPSGPPHPAARECALFQASSSPITHGPLRGILLRAALLSIHPARIPRSLLSSRPCHSNSVGVWGWGSASLFHTPTQAAESLRLVLPLLFSFVSARLVVPSDQGCLRVDSRREQALPFACLYFFVVEHLQKSSPAE